VRILLSLLLLISFLGCASKGIKIEGGKYSLIRLQKVAQASLPNGQEFKSPNGRSFRSKYYDPYNSARFNFNQGPTRHFAVINVLGDRRPFEIEVIVYEERKTAGARNAGYQVYGVDPKATQALAIRIQAKLDQRKGNRDFIDDFKAF
jgi:hypothetical protein